MKKASLIVAIAAVISVAALSVFSVKAVEYIEAWDRDPITGYTSTQGQSFSYVYQYALYNPVTDKYFGIQQDHDWGWQGSFQHDVWTAGEPDPNGPWCWTKVWFQNASGWNLDTEAWLDFS